MDRAEGRVELGGLAGGRSSNPGLGDPRPGCSHQAGPSPARESQGEAAGPWGFLRRLGRSRGHPQCRASSRDPGETVPCKQRASPGGEGTAPEPAELGRTPRPSHCERDLSEHPVTSFLCFPPSRTRVRPEQFPDAPASWYRTIAADQGPGAHRLGLAERSGQSGTFFRTQAHVHSLGFSVAGPAAPDVPGGPAAAAPRAGRAAGVECGQVGRGEGELGGPAMASPPRGESQAAGGRGGLFCLQ